MPKLYQVLGYLLLYSVLLPIILDFAIAILFETYARITGKKLTWRDVPTLEESKGSKQQCFHVMTLGLIYLAILIRRFKTYFALSLQSNPTSIILKLQSSTEPTKEHAEQLAEPASLGKGTHTSLELAQSSPPFPVLELPIKKNNADAILLHNKQPPSPSLPADKNLALFKPMSSNDLDVSASSSRKLKDDDLHSLQSRKPTSSQEPASVESLLDKPSRSRRVQKVRIRKTRYIPKGNRMKGPSPESAGSNPRKNERPFAAALPPLTFTPIRLRPFSNRSSPRPESHSLLPSPTLVGDNESLSYQKLSDHPETDEPLRNSNWHLQSILGRSKDSVTPNVPDSPRNSITDCYSDPNSPSPPQRRSTGRVFDMPNRLNEVDVPNFLSLSPTRILESRTWVPTKQSSLSTVHVEDNYEPESSATSPTRTLKSNAGQVRKESLLSFENPKNSPSSEASSRAPKCSYRNVETPTNQRSPSTSIVDCDHESQRPSPSLVESCHETAGVESNAEINESEVPIQSPNDSASKEMPRFGDTSKTDNANDSASKEIQLSGDTSMTDIADNCTKHRLLSAIKSWRLPLKENWEDLITFDPAWKMSPKTLAVEVRQLETTCFNKTTRKVVAFTLHGTQEYYDFDLLKSFVCLCFHVFRGRIWPEGYVPKTPWEELKARDDDEMSYDTYDTASTTSDVEDTPPSVTPNRPSRPRLPS